MKSKKVKLSLLFTSIVLLTCCFLGFTSYNLNNDDINDCSQAEQNIDQTPVLKKAKSVPQSPDEVFNSVPSKETLDNLPEYINKSIELLDNESEQVNDAAVDNGTPNFFNIFKNGEIHKIYAVIKKDDEFYKLILTANKPEDGTYDDVYEITDTDEGVPAYCTKYVSKITSIDIDQSVENFHPVSTMQWFGSYIESSAKFPSSRLKTINGLRYLNMDKVTNSAYMFSGTKYLNSISDEDIEFIKGNTNYLESLENASGMFIGSGLDSKYLNVFLTKFANSNSLKYCQYSFGLCNNLKNFENKNILLPKIENATAMFARSSIERFDNNIIFGNPIYSITSLFYECHNLSRADISSMLENGTSYYIEKDGSTIIDKISSTVSAFQSCENLTYVDLGKWEVSDKEGSAHITYTYDMFSGCTRLSTIDARYDANWSQIVKESSNMFAGCISLVGQNRTAYNSTNIHMGYARIDEGKTNPGYFTLSKNSPEPPSEEAIYSLSLDGFSQPGVTYLPVCDDSHRLPNDLVFYDDNMNKINPSNGSYYLMSDLKNAKSFSGTSSFDCFRNFDNVAFDEVYEYSGEEVRQEFLDKLLPNEQLVSFPYSSTTPPRCYDVSFCDIYNSYQLSRHLYWSNEEAEDLQINAFYFDASLNKYKEESKDNKYSVMIKKTLNPSSMTPIKSKYSCYFDYDDSIVEKVTNVSGDKTYPKNTKINYLSDFKFKVVMKDGVSVSRAYDGINELENEDNIFTVGDRYGLHSINIDKQTKFNINFEKDDRYYITDKDGKIINTPVEVQINENFEFKVKYNNLQKHVIKDVKVDNQIIEPDHQNCYELKNITNHKKVVISSQLAEPLYLYKGVNLYSYYPVFDKLSANQIKFYDKEGKYIWPTANDGHDYVMSDLKNVQTYIGSGYKFQAIRINQDKWSSFDEKDGKATKYNGEMIDGDCCASLSFDKGNDRPLVGGVFIGDIINAYEDFANLRNFWGSDVVDTENSYLYELNDTKDKGSWKTFAKDEVENVVIQHEFSDCYDIKFNVDTGVKQILDSEGKDISNGIRISKSNFPLRFKVVCYEDTGTDSVLQSDISISGKKYDAKNLIYDKENSLYALNDIKDYDVVGCEVSVTTVNHFVSFTDNGCHYYPVFNSISTEDCKFYDKYGQYIEPENDQYVMSDTVTAVKCKYFTTDIQPITGVRAINERMWKKVFKYPRTPSETEATEIQETFIHEHLHANDRICFWKGNYDEKLVVDDVSFNSVYDIYKNYGFASDNASFWSATYGPDKTYGMGWLYANYFHNLTDRSFNISKIDNIETPLDSDCYVIVAKQFEDKSTTIDFTKDSGIEKVTNEQGDEINETVSIEKGSSFTFRIFFKDGYAENYVNDGVVPIKYDKDNNSYTINNIQSQHIINISSQKSISLKSSANSKHQNLIYKPVFNKLSVNSVKFYDNNGHFLVPSQDNNTNYVMQDIKDTTQFVAYGTYNFKAVIITEHTWNEAFGKDTIGFAEKYVAGDMDACDECESIYFDIGNSPVVNGVKLSDIKKAYYNDYKYFWANDSTVDQSYCFEISDDKEDVKEYDRSSYAAHVVLSKNFTDTCTVNFKKDIGVNKIVDENNNELPDVLNVQANSTLRFKINYKQSFTNENTTISDETIQTDSSFFYNVEHITSNFSINIKSQARHMGSLIIGNDWYHPVYPSKELTTEHFIFYDYDGHKLEATGEPAEGSKYMSYKLTDLKLAAQYEFLTKYGFDAIRSVNNIRWDAVFDENKDVCTEDDIKPEFQNTLNEGDKVHIYAFEKMDEDQEPWMFEYGFNSIWDTYKDDPSFIPDKAIWGNWKADDYDPHCAMYWDFNDHKWKTNFMYESNGKSVIVSKLFGWDDEIYQTINLQKPDEIEGYYDLDGKKLEDKVTNERSTDFQFKVKTNNGYAIDKVYFNDEVIECNDEGIYTVNSTLMDNKISATVIKTESLFYDGELYHPIFKNQKVGNNGKIANEEKVCPDNVKFYDGNGKFLLPTGIGETYTMNDVAAATQYIAKENFRFKAVRTEKYSWTEAFGKDIESGTATKFMQEMKLGDTCSSLNFHNDIDLSIDDVNGYPVSINNINDAYLNCTNFWTADCRASDAWQYYYDTLENKWIFNCCAKYNNNNIVFERLFGHESSNINFIFDENIEKATDIYDTEIKKQVSYSTASDFKFKLVTKSNYVVKSVFVNDEKLIPNGDGVYVISHPKGNLNIKVESAFLYPLVIGDRTYHPIFDYAPANKIAFYDADNNYIRPTGNNGYSYTINNLQFATQFAYFDDTYSFDAVCLYNFPWEAAFGIMDEAGVAPKYIQNLDLNQSCTAMDFEYGQRPYMSGVSLDDIAKIYFDKTTFWSPISVDKEHASLYEVDNGWIDKAEKDSPHSILIQRTFSSNNMHIIQFDKDEGISSIKDDQGIDINDKLNVVPGQDLRFKVDLNENYIIDRFTFGDLDLKLKPDGYYHVLINSSSILNSTRVKLATIKTHSLRAKVFGDNEYYYKPIFKTLSFDTIQFYDEDGKIIVPSQDSGKTYIMRDLKNATQFAAQQYCFDAVVMKECDWSDVFGFVQTGRATEIVPPIELNQTCASLYFDKDVVPEISDISINDIASSYYDVTSYWLPFSTDNSLASVYDINSLWKHDEQKINNHGILLKTTMSDISSKSLTINEYEGVDNVVNDRGIEMKGINNFIPGQDFKFKVNLRDDYIIDNVTLETNISDFNLLQYKDGFYHLLFDKQLLDQTIRNFKISTSKLKPLTVNDILYKPIIDEKGIPTSDVKFYKDREYIRPEYGSSYHMSDLVEANRYIATGDYRFKAIGVKAHTWGEAFEADSQGIAVRYKLSDLDSATKCVTLGFEEKVDPIVEGHKLSEFKNIYFKNVNDYWGNLYIGNDKATVYRFGSDPEPYWDNDDITESMYIVAVRDFTSESSNIRINTIKDKNIFKLVGDDGKELPLSMNVSKNSSLKFKVIAKSGCIVRQVMIGNKIIRPDKNGYYYVFNINKDVNIRAK